MIFHREVWAYAQLLIGFVIPLLIICTSYMLLVYRLKSIINGRAKRFSNKKTPNKKMTRTVIVVVVMFIICQVPYHVMELVSIAKVMLVHF